MNVVTAPVLDGRASERLCALGAQLVDPGSWEATSRQSTAGEAIWPRGTPLLYLESRTQQGSIASARATE